MHAAIRRTVSIAGILVFGVLFAWLVSAPTPCVSGTELPLCAGVLRLEIVVTCIIAIVMAFLAVDLDAFLSGRRDPH